MTEGPRRFLALLIWPALALVLVVPVAIAASSPFLPSRSFAYVVASFAGILSLGLLLCQPLLAAGYLPGLPQARRWHRLLGTGIIIAVLLHIGGLYLTSPPDTIDALLLVSPTPFSVYGVIALCGILLTALLVALRRKSGLPHSAWRIIHNAVAAVVVLATIIHAVQIEGLMGQVSKLVLCIALATATIVALVDVHLLGPRRRRLEGKA
ncbi:MAG: ferric reductase [Tabrizicola sp.]|nr:ferric reductase [Tabrizicola sp.]